MRLTPILLSLALSAAAALPAAAQSNWGAYLAARHAGAQSDFEAAADYFTRALVSDPTNGELISEYFEDVLTSEDDVHCLVCHDDEPVVSTACRVDGLVC